MVDLGEDEDKFESFMAPITSKSLSCSFPLYDVMSALMSVLMVSITWPSYFDIYSTLKFVVLLPGAMDSVASRLVAVGNNAFQQEETKVLLIDFT